MSGQKNRVGRSKNDAWHIRSLIGNPIGGFHLCPWRSRGDPQIMIPQRPDPVRVTDVIVVGAGLSGLSAARLLVDSDVTVLVLEATDRVGGRTLTKSNQTGTAVDLGGSHIRPTQNHIQKLADELNLERQSIESDLQCVHYYNGSRRLYNSFKHPCSSNPLVKLDLLRTNRKLHRMGKEVSASCPWLAPHASEWDNITMKEFAKKNMWTKTARDFLEKILVTSTTATEANEVSLLRFLWCTKQSHDYDALSRLSKLEKFIDGSQIISDRLSEKLGGRVLLEKSVWQLKQTKDYVTATTADGHIYHAQYVIFTIPLPLLSKIHFSPNLPTMLTQLVETVTTAPMIKTVVFYNRPFWKEQGLSGFILISDDNVDHPFTYAMDDTRADGTLPAITGVILGNKARQMLTHTRTLRVRLICMSLAEVYGSQDALQPIHYEEQIWCDSRYLGGSISYPPGCLTNYGSALRDNYGRIFFAGTETATHWAGYMDGAVSSGQKSAKEILVQMGKIPMDEMWRDMSASKLSIIFDNPPGLSNVIVKRASCWKIVAVVSSIVIVSSITVFYYGERIVRIVGLVFEQNRLSSLCSLFV